VIGCVRKYRGWSYAAIMNEYIHYALPKVRFEDQMMIEYFEFEDPNAYNATELVVEKDSKEKKEKKEKKDKKDKTSEQDIITSEPIIVDPDPQESRSES
jgi:hypothetical protein